MTRLEAIRRPWLAPHVEQNRFVAVAEIEVSTRVAPSFAQGRFEGGQENLQLLMKVNPELLGGLALNDGDEALVDVTPAHDKHVGEALARVEDQRGGFPKMG